ncbi:MAG: ATP-binding protein [Deltaproteobacteria bacterium]
MDPDTILANLDQPGRGKLTIFLGAAAGVGKTYKMLETARDRLAEGFDVVIGYVETHERHETDALLKGIPLVSRKTMEYRGRQFLEMDLDDLLKRRPQIALVDELAHTNIPGARHNKRYQDVEELLSAGINIYTTLNIQHLETMNDIVAQITGVVVKETVPDRILEAAFQIQLVDIPPEELIQRFKEGKVYVADQANDALKKFFRPGNINALRELAMRYTAQRVDHQLESYMQMHGIVGPWPTGEKLMVCISASPLSAQLLRVAKRIANGLQAELLAVYVETPRRFPVTEAQKDSLAKNIRLAEDLGAQIVNLTGDDIAEEIIDLARKRNVSQIIMGKPEHTRMWEIINGSVVDRVIRYSKGLSVHVIPGDTTKVEHPITEDKSYTRQAGTDLHKPVISVIYPYVMTIIMMVVLTIIFLNTKRYLGLVNISLLYLLPVVISANRWGTKPALFSSAIGIIAFDFLFVPPVFSFTVADIKYVISFAIYVFVALLTAKLSARLKRQIINSRIRENQTSALYGLSRDIAAVDTLDIVLQGIAKKVGEAIEADVSLLLPDENANIALKASSGNTDYLDQSELAVASWVLERGHKAGKGSGTLEGAAALYFPMITEQDIQGVMGVRFQQGVNITDQERMRLLEAFVGLAAMAINRIKLSEETRRVSNLAESERLRTALFNSISHDLRTPLASIIGAVTSLMQKDCVYTPAASDDLLQTIYQGADRMNRFVNNLLDMARLEAGVLKLNKELIDIQDIIGVAVSRMDTQLNQRSFSMTIAPDLPMIEVDFVLIEQVLINLLDNALKYSEYNHSVSIHAGISDGEVLVTVANEGPTISVNDLDRIFDKFYRLSSPRLVSGTGLGLAICKEIIELHGGRIWAENKDSCGVMITFVLPAAGKISVYGGLPDGKE